MALRLSTAARNAACNGIVDLLDAGAGAGTIAIRTGAQPTNVGDADTGTLLGTLTFSDPAFGNAATGVATASAITSDTNADASGTAGHARAKDSDGNIVFDLTCGQGAGDISFDNNVIVDGHGPDLLMPLLYGRCVAPPIRASDLARWSTLARDMEPAVRDRFLTLLELIGRDRAGDLRELPLTQSDLAFFGVLFERLQEPYRTPAFHLLWAARELSLGRQPTYE